MIKNIGNDNLNNINWSLNISDSIIYSDELISLQPNESIFVYVEHEFSAGGNYTVIATAFDGVNTDSKNISVMIEESNIDVYNFSLIGEPSATHKIFEFMIKNIAENQNLTGISWSLNTGLGTINSIYTYNLTPNNFSFVFVEYNYTQTGDFTPTASATSGSNQDSETIEIEISGLDIVASNLTLIYNSSLHRIFFFTITNMLSIQLTNVNWTFDTDDNNIISASQIFSLNESKEAFIFVEYNYSSTGTYNVNATAINGSLKDSINYTFMIT